MLRFFVFLSAVFVTSSLSAEGIDIARRHVVMLHAGIDTVWGTYMFGVRNDTDEPQTRKVQLMLPKETIDFQAQDGLTQSEIKVTDEGLLYIEKEFAKGLNLLAVGFKVPAEFGKATLTFEAPFELAEFSLVTKKNTLSVLSDVLLLEESNMVNSEKFLSYKKKGAVLTNEIVIVTLEGIPQGRTALWWIGSIMGVLLVLFAALFTFWTRVKGPDEEMLAESVVG